MAACNQNEMLDTLEDPRELCSIFKLETLIGMEECIGGHSGPRSGVALRGKMENIEECFAARLAQTHSGLCSEKVEHF